MIGLLSFRPSLMLCLTATGLVASAGSQAAAVAEAAPLQSDLEGSNAGDDLDLNVLLLEVNVGNDRLTDDLYAYEVGDDVLIPIGELARLLAIGITINQEHKTASGFVLREDSAFRLDLASGTVAFSDQNTTFDRRLVRWIDGDIYVSSRLLRTWWPIDIKLDKAALRLEVLPREKLPFQAKREREKREQQLAKNRSSARGNPDFAYVRSPYRALSAPFIDNTLALDLRATDGRVSTNAAYSGFLTGDLLGMEAAGYLAFSKQRPSPQARITLARHDPDGGLLGPLSARSVVLGSIGLPVIDNVLRGTGVGNGLLVSNRPLHQPSSYRSQTLRGELPPGWDVTLYFNDGLIGFQQARGDGLYEFSDQPLIYGRNEFRLVFNGPLGQTRVERQVFQLDQTLSAPGELFYTVAGQRDDRGGVRAAVQMDYGIIDNASVTLGGVYVDAKGSNTARAYVNIGARAALFGAMVNADHVRDLSGGNLTELGVRTSLWGVSIDASRAWLNGFHSEFFDRQSDQLTVRDRLRVTKLVSLGRLKLPMALDVERERYASGKVELTLEHRLSLNVLGTSFTNQLGWRTADGPDDIDGVLQISRRLAGAGMRGQLTYSVSPEARLKSVAISADKHLGGSNRLNVGVMHELHADRTMVTAGLNRNFGAFGLGVSGMFGGLRNFGIGLQLFSAVHWDPQSKQVVGDWRPLASSGMIAARVFVDDNQNGIYDVGEDPVEGVSFKVGHASRHPTKTAANGVALLKRLTPKEYVDVSVDAGTVGDAQLQPARPGVRVLPRPGKAQAIDFPLVLTGEIDGTVALLEDGETRNIGNALVELVTEDGEVIGSTRSSSDGFYILPSVRPGKYRLRISPAQARELDLFVAGQTSVTMPADADFISGINLTVTKRPSPSRAGPQRTAGQGTDECAPDRCRIEYEDVLRATEDFVFSEIAGTELAGAAPAADQCALDRCRIEYEGVLDHWGAS